MKPRNLHINKQPQVILIYNHISHQYLMECKGAEAGVHTENRMVHQRSEWSLIWKPSLPGVGVFPLVTSETL